MKRTTIILLALLALLVSGTGVAQQTTNGATPAETQPASPPPKASVLDPEEAIRLTRELAKTGDLATGLEAVQVFIDSAEDTFDSRLDAYLDPSDLERMTEAELREGRGSAGLSLTAVEDWRSRLATRLAELGKAREQLRELEVQWTDRLETERQAGSPVALLDRIRELLKSITESRKDLGKRTQERLEIDNQLLALEDRLRTVVANLDKALLVSKGQLFTLDQPPLWGMLAGAEDTPGIEVLRALLSRLTAGVGQFWQTYQDRAILQFGLLVALVAGMVALGRSPAIQALEAMSGSVRVLQRPAASALLLVLFLTPALYVSMPLILRSANALLSLLPILLLIPTFAPPAWRPLFYLVAALFGMEVFASLIPASIVPGRLVVLAMSAAGLWAATAGVRKPLQVESFRQWRWAGLARGVRRVVILAFIAAIVANLVGAARLAKFLNGSIIAPVYISLGLTALTFVLDDFFRLLLNSRIFTGSRAVNLHRTLLLQRLGRITRWLAVAFWIWLTLRYLDILPAAANAAGSLLTASVNLGTYELSVGNALLFLLAVWIALQTARFVGFVLDNDVLPRMRLARGLPGTISTTTKYLIIGIGLLFAASAAGIDLTQITLIIGALSVGIGFGLQNVVNNFISGIILLFERPIQVGDTIQVGELFGVVRGIGIRASRVRTYDGAEVIVPNGELIASQVINWTLSDRHRRLQLDVGVAYGNRPADVITVLERVTDSHELVLKHPEPIVRFRGFGDSSLDFRLYVWVDFDEGLATTSAIMSDVYDALAEAGIEIPFPQRDLHLKSVGDSAGRALRGDTT